MASAVASASANAQHNLLALQTQLQSLQLENATLTKALTLRENSLLQKEQQLRVLQQRLDDLEGGVARWKDRYLQQLQANDAAAASATTSSEATTTSDWTPVPLPARSGELPDADAMGALVDKLTTADRERLKKLLGAERARTSLAPWEESFGDASPELARVLLQYLMPVLRETQRLAHQRGERAMQVACLTRTYTKQATDFRIVCQRSPSETAATTPQPPQDSHDAGASSPSSGLQHPQQTSHHARTPSHGGTSAVTLAPDAVSSTSHRGSYGSESSSSSTTVATAASGRSSLAAAAERLPAVEDVHLFDCVDCESAKRNGVAAAAVPHGPREIHATKAVYISRPLTTPPTAGLLDAARRSFKPAGSSDAATTYNDLDSDRRSGASSSSLTGSAPSAQSGKIKKIMGSVMKGLNRHKPPSSSQQQQGQGGQYPLVSTPNSMVDGDGDDTDSSICDGCGRGLFTGVKWVCRTCRLHKDQEYALCEKCYGQGLHGKENEDALFERIEEIVVAKCPKLAREQDLMKLLRVGICKANLKKYSFCLTWIADLLLCKATKDLRARALEISQISPQVRSEFVRVLTDLLTKHRRDIELITEWQPVQNVTGAGGGGGSGEGGSSMLQLDTLRIWVKDAVVEQ